MHYRSGKQDVVAKSSTQAGLASSFEAAKEIIYFRDVLEELGLSEIVPTPLYIDKKSLITHQRKQKESQTLSHASQLSHRTSQETSDSVCLHTD